MVSITVPVLVSFLFYNTLATQEPTTKRWLEVDEAFVSSDGGFFNGLYIGETDVKEFNILKEIVAKHQPSLPDSVIKGIYLNNLLERNNLNKDGQNKKDDKVGNDIKKNTPKKSEKDKTQKDKERDKDDIPTAVEKEKDKVEKKDEKTPKGSDKDEILINVENDDYSNLPKSVAQNLFLQKLLNQNYDYSNLPKSVAQSLFLQTLLSGQDNESYIKHLGKGGKTSSSSKGKGSSKSSSKMSKKGSKSSKGEEDCEISSSKSGKGSKMSSSSSKRYSSKRYSKKSRTCSPSTSPSTDPSPAPSTQPSLLPTALPSNSPSVYPSDIPSIEPTPTPTNIPTTTKAPQSAVPTNMPKQEETPPPTKAPTILPTKTPTTSRPVAPTIPPTRTPQAPTLPPTEQPTRTPTTPRPVVPTVAPTPRPVAPTRAPTTRRPTRAPTRAPQAPTNPPVRPPIAGSEVEASPFTTTYDLTSGATPSQEDYEVAAQITCEHVDEVLATVFDSPFVVFEQSICTVSTTTDNPPRVTYDVTVVFADDSEIIPDTESIDRVVQVAFEQPSEESLLTSLGALPASNPFSTTTDVTYQKATTNRLRYDREIMALIEDLSEAKDPNFIPSFSRDGKRPRYLASLLLVGIVAAFVTIIRLRRKLSSSAGIFH